ncbi:TetR/AcrR family transcriptional regulator [Sinimarinibacterium thermocellulolyticum]|uniref:TetR/AcrR family transcriptional regulator n=1 Tax=Sinimarinibacterium thermocellulolyticum TaxID=3170016 RepID=A0ABV2ABG6_9GAMM
MLHAATEAQADKGRRWSRRDTREAILECAEELLQRRGYGGFAYQHIAVQLGIRNAAIHYHFPAKEDLGVALVRRYRERFAQWVAALPAQLDAWSRLQAYFSTYRAYLAERKSSDDCLLCPGGALAAEFCTLPEPMRLEIRLLMRDVQDWLCATLEQGRRDGELHFEGDALDKAVEIGAALQGGLQIARMSGAARFYRLLDQLALELNPLRVEAAGGSLP